MLHLSSTAFQGLWKCSHFVAPCVTKWKVARFLPVSGASPRHFITGIPLTKDALQPREPSEEVQSIDLNKWKSVMRSQAALEEKQQPNDEGEADDEKLVEPEGNLKGTSLLEATRDMVAMWRLAGKLVPEELTDEQLEELSGLTTKSSRKKYLKFLAIKEGHKKSRKGKQQQKKAEREALFENDRPLDVDAQEDGDQKNTFILKFWKRSLDKLLGWRGAQAMMFGQPLVFDMSYESNMARREMENTVSQLLEVEGWNRRSEDPYHLHFCNLQPNGLYKQELLKRHGAESWDRQLITSTDRQHVDVFPREQLVYLTADSPNVLSKYDHSKVYIIGALVDRSIQSGLSLANAKRLKLATARLPLDQFLNWDIGGKNLTLDQMIRIMITLKETGSWKEALKFVPTRKHGGFQQVQGKKETFNDRVLGVKNHGPQVGDRWLKSGGQQTFKNELHRPQKQYGRDRMAAVSSDREKTAAARVRTSFKTSLEGRKGAGKGKVWWNDK